MKIKLLLLVLILLSLVLTLLLFTFRSKDNVATTSDDEEWVMVAAYPDDSWFQEIYGVSAKNPKNLVLDVSSIGDQPEWSHDGQWIIYSTLGFGKERSILFLEKSDGTKKIRITEGYSPRWSPDGGNIAYTFHDKIYLVNTRCFIEYRSCDTKPSFIADGQSPAWSPKGDSIVFYFRQAIYVIKIDTSEIHEVFAPQNGGCLEPDWSSTNKILFRCWGDYVGLYTINSDGTNLEKIDTGGRGGVYPRWSPSGEKIASIHYLSVNSEEARSAVYIIDAGGNNPPVRLTENDNYRINWFAWMPPYTKPEACTIFCK
jgi:Tol biopolymer transport system component